MASIFKYFDKNIMLILVITKSTGQTLSICWSQSNTSSCGNTINSTSSIYQKEQQQQQQILSTTRLVDDAMIIRRMMMMMLSPYWPVSGSFQWRSLSPTAPAIRIKVQLRFWQLGEPAFALPSSDLLRSLVFILCHPHLTIPTIFRQICFLPGHCTGCSSSISSSSVSNSRLAVAIKCTGRHCLSLNLPSHNSITLSVQYCILPPL